MKRDFPKIAKSIKYVYDRSVLQTYLFTEGIS